LSGLVVYFVTPAGTQAKVIDGVFAPFSDNAKSLGSTSLRWTITYTGNVLLTQAATSGGAGTIALGGTHASTVGAAGAASALPATPLGYMIANVDGTQVKIPYYNT
jgi:hypothetical protein